MTDQQPRGPPDPSATDGEPTESADEREHDCQQHLEYIDSEWVDSCYDDLYVCGVCEKEFRMVYLKAFLLAEEDFSLIEEHTGEIEDQLEQHLNHDVTGWNGAEESADT